MRGRLVRGFFIAFLAAEAVLTLLPGETYLWRMFSTRAPEIRAEVIDAARQRRPIDWYLHVSFPRKGVDFWSLLPAHLCRVYPDAAAIALHRDSESREVACH